ncbi:hypothetical protein LIG30_2337 [Burkholderia sp. lig30]|nr:hypothetical protein LIG30_2337 [Burkholderia sp. lig30]
MNKSLSLGVTNTTVFTPFPDELCVTACEAGIPAVLASMHLLAPPC